MCKAINSQGEKSDILDLQCKRFKIEKGINYETWFHSKLLYVSNEFFYREGQQHNLVVFCEVAALNYRLCILSLLNISSFFFTYCRVTSQFVVWGASAAFSILAESSLHCYLSLASSVILTRSSETFHLVYVNILAVTTNWWKKT